MNKPRIKFSSDGNLTQEPDNIILFYSFYFGWGAKKVIDEILNANN